MIPESGERSHQDLSLRTAKFHVATITDDLHVLNAESSCLLILIAAPRHTSHCASKWTQAWLFSLETESTVLFQDILSEQATWFHATIVRTVTLPSGDPTVTCMAPSRLLFRNHVPFEEPEWAGLGWLGVWSLRLWILAHYTSCLSGDKLCIPCLRFPSTKPEQ